MSNERELISRLYPKGSLVPSGLSVPDSLSTVYVYYNGMEITGQNRDLVNRLESKYSDLLGFLPNTAILKPEGRNITLLYPGEGFIYARLRKKDDTWVIDHIATLHHGQHIGSLLLRYLAPPIELKCLKDSPFNSWWRRQGFQSIRTQTTSIGRDLVVWRRENPWDEKEVSDLYDEDRKRLDSKYRERSSSSTQE